MLETKLVVRILDAEDRLLGWTQVVGKAYGDGTLRVDDPAPVRMDASGIPASQSVHWCDVNVEVRTPLPSGFAQAGTVLTLQWRDPAIVIGPAAGGLPPVTVQTPIAIDVMTGALGARTLP